MIYRCFLGVDPGKSGGWAIVGQAGDVVLTCKADNTHRDIFLMLREHSPEFALLEYVSSSPQQGVRSAFTFGQSYGAIEAILACVGVPFDRITPRKWQTSMRCLSGGDKNVTKFRAQELFPAAKVTHAIADALLLAELCRRRRMGESELVRVQEAGEIVEG